MEQLEGVGWQSQSRSLGSISMVGSQTTGRAVDHQTMPELKSGPSSPPLVSLAGTLGGLLGFGRDARAQVFFRRHRADGVTIFMASARYSNILSMY